MKKLAIYEPDSPLDAIVSAAPNGGCNDCELGSRAGISPCISVEGRDQGWLVISDLPTAADNVTRMPFTSNAGKTVRTILSQKAPNIPMAFVHAVGCATSEAEEEHVDACRKYVKHAIERTNPKAILLLGSLSAYSLLGHGVAPDAATGGYAFIRKLNNPERPLPVWFGPDPVNIARNRLVRAKFSKLIDKMVNWKWRRHHGAQIGAHTFVVVTEEDAQEIYDRILLSSDQPTVGIDVETWRPAFHSQEIVSLALSWYEGDQIVSAVWDTEGLDPFDGGVATLRRLLQDDAIAKVAHNGKFDQHALAADPSLTPLVAYVADTRLLCKLINPTAPADLANCAVHVGMGGHKKEARDTLQEVKKQLTKYATSLLPTPSGKARPPYTPPLIPVHTIPAELLQEMHNKEAELDSWVYRWLPQDVRIRYNARDTAATIKLWRELQDQLTPGQQLVFHEVVMPATHALTQMEEWGLPIDRDMLNLLQAHIELELDPVKQRLQSYAPLLGGEFNPGSRPQLIKVLEAVGLSPKGKTKTGGISTDDKSLEPLRTKHPIVNDILEWRHLTKMLSTYVEGVRNSICPDGKIHATALLDGTETGRLSYQRPNLQNWPRASTVEGKMLRDCVAAPPGWVLVEIDQSQVEIRVAAALSQDPDMLEIINSGKDFHSATAELIYGSNFTDEQRTESKTCIAEGQLVLTDTGLKPIESVRLHDLVWDGMEWVRHDGVVFQGERDVIEYAGLTATPDHMVFTAEGGAVPFGAAASRLAGRRLAVGGNGGVPARYTYPHGAHRAGGEGADEVLGGDVLRVPRHLCSVRIQHSTQEDHGMCLPEGGEVRQRPAGQGARGKVLSHGAAVQQPEVQMVQKLRRARHHAPIRVPQGVYPVGPGAPPAPDLQGCSDRPDQQQRALRAGQPAARVVRGEPAKYQGESAGRVLRGAYRGGGPVPGHCTSVPELPTRGAHGTQSCSQMVRGRHSSGWGGIRCGDGCVRRRARVYDIANAGPRSRFTVSGYIVSNCNFSLIYEIPENIGYMLSKSLSAATKKNVTREDAQRIADMIFGRYKRLREWMSERHKAGMAQGGAFTKWRGMDARFRPLPNLGLPYSGDRNDPNKPLVETAIRSTWNMPVQGTAADLTTAALSPIVRWIQDSNAQARLLVTIHDSVVGIVHESALAEYISVATEAMTAHAGWLGVKLNADVKIGKRLGQMQKYKVP